MAPEFSFSCPLCHSFHYLPVYVKRPNGSEYRTEFYQCAACTVMFRDPVRFTRGPLQRAETERHQAPPVRTVGRVKRERRAPG